MSIRRPVLWAIVALVALVAAAIAMMDRQSVVRNPTGKVLESGATAFDPIRSDEIQSILPQMQFRR